MPVSEPDLSVVLAVRGDSAIEEALAALEQGCEGISTELIVVHAGGGSWRELPPARFMAMQIRDMPAGTLTPVLWGAGFVCARGRIVAFTTDQLRVSPTWARALLGAMKTGVAGVGGPIELVSGADPATAAAYFLRFSLYTAAAWPAPATARDIPGDNAAYRRDEVSRHADLLREGFWEVEYHRRFEREGLVLKMVPGAHATLIGPVPMGGMLHQRFRHGREFGVSRTRRHGESRIKLLVLAPFIPLVLLARIGRRVLPSRLTRGRFLLALPLLGLLATAWAAGEVAGALSGKNGGRDR